MNERARNTGTVGRGRYERLVEAITSKLAANRDTLDKNVRKGTVSWRVTRNGEVEVQLQTEL